MRNFADSSHRSLQASYWALFFWGWAKTSFQRTTYTNFRTTPVLVASLAGLFTFHQVYLLWFPALMLISWFFYRQAFARRSFYFIVVIVLYAYIALCYVIVRLLSNMSLADLVPIALGLMYFIVSAIGVASLLVKLNRQLKTHDRP